VAPQPAKKARLSPRDTPHASNNSQMGPLWTMKGRLLSRLRLPAKMPKTWRQQVWRHWMLPIMWHATCRRELRRD